MTFAIEVVARGSQLLDEHYPGWADKIDSANLDIPSGKMCVLGQLYGWWGRGLMHLDMHVSMCCPSDYGFAPVWDVPLEALHEAWREAIASRRLERVPQEAIAAA